MDCSTPGLPVHYQLLEFTQTRVHQVSDAIQPSHPLSSPSPPAFSLSQHQGLNYMRVSLIETQQGNWLQARNPGVSCMPFSRGSSWPKHPSLKSPVLAGGFFTSSTTWEAQGVSYIIWIEQQTQQRGEGQGWGCRAERSIRRYLLNQF